MKTFLKFLVVLPLFILSFASSSTRAQDTPPPPDNQGPPPDQGAPGGPAEQGAPGDGGDQGDQGASFQNFYDQLGDQGQWVQTDDYGYAFQPNVSDPNWAPYTNGHWVYTDQGWTWVSDEPWGWATYHYGRWANIDGTGWVWIPGYRWAPAWVSWRYGGGYCGWAPLPPGTFVGAEYGEPGFDAWSTFHFGGDVDVSFNIGPGCYNFLRVGDMGYSNYRGHFIDRGRNFAVINNTTNITNINISRNSGGTGANFRGVVAKGPPLSEVNAHSHQHVSTMQLTASNQPGLSRVQGNSLAVFAPRVNPSTGTQARPARVAQTISHPSFNRGDSITKPLDVTAHVRAPAPTSAAIQAAQTAQAHIPAKAKVATASTPTNAAVNRPLTSLTPAAQVHRTTNATTPGTSNVNRANSPTTHSTANSPFTGESTAPRTETHVQPSTTHSTASSPFTGESTAPRTETHVQPATTDHSQRENTQRTETESRPAPAYHPQTQSAGGQAFHPQGAGGPPSHTQAAPVNHPAPSAPHPAPAAHPGSAAGGKPTEGGNKQGQ
jgi:hypothetical protein